MSNGGFAWEQRAQGKCEGKKGHNMSGGREEERGWVDKGVDI